jgi:hypothetical protein
MFTLGTTSVDWEGMGMALIILCHLMGGIFIFAYLMQFNTVTMEVERFKELKKEWKTHGAIKALLRWYFITPFKVAADRYKQTKGMLWLVLIGIFLIVAGQMLYKVIEPKGW